MPVQRRDTACIPEALGSVDANHHHTTTPGSIGSGSQQPMDPPSPVTACGHCQGKLTADIKRVLCSRCSTAYCCSNCRDADQYSRHAHCWLANLHPESLSPMYTRHILFSILDHPESSDKVEALALTAHYITCPERCACDYKDFPRLSHWVQGGLATSVAQAIVNLAAGVAAHTTTTSTTTTTNEPPSFNNRGVPAASGGHMHHGSCARPPFAPPKHGRVGGVGGAGGDASVPAVRRKVSSFEPLPPAPPGVPPLAPGPAGPALLDALRILNRLLAPPPPPAEGDAAHAQPAHALPLTEKEQREVAVALVCGLKGGALEGAAALALGQDVGGPGAVHELEALVAGILHLLAPGSVPTDTFVPVLVKAGPPMHAVRLHTPAAAAPAGPEEEEETSHTSHTPPTSDTSHTSHTSASVSMTDAADNAHAAASSAQPLAPQASSEAMGEAAGLASDAAGLGAAAGPLAPQSTSVRKNTVSNEPASLKAKTIPGRGEVKGEVAVQRVKQSLAKGAGAAGVANLRAMQEGGLPTPALAMCLL